MKKILITFVTLSTLTSCTPDMGPANIKIQVENDVTLSDSHNNRILFKKGEALPVTVAFSGTSKKVSIRFNDEKFTFHKGVLDAKKGTLYVNPAKSKQINADGSPVGLSLQRTLLDRREERHYSERQCTRYVEHTYERCTTDGNGHRSCTSYVERTPVIGYETVRYIRVERDFKYDGRLINDSDLTLASASGIDTDISYYEDIVRSCF